MSKMKLLTWLFVAGIMQLIVTSHSFASNPLTPSGGNTQAQHQSTSPQKHKATENSQNNNAPISVTIQQPVILHEVISQPENQNHWYTKADWWTAGFTGALFFATLGLWVVTGLMWWVTRKVAIDGMENIKIANRSAQAAEDMLIHAQNTSKKELRAYVLVRPTNFGFDGVNKPVVSCAIVNIGKTPAKDIEIFSKLDILEFSSAFDTFVIPDISRRGQPIFNLQPQEALDGPTRPDPDRVFTSLEIKEAIEGKKRRLHIFGYARYFDIFGDPHETPFVTTCSGGPGLNDVFNCRKFKTDDTPRFEANTFDRKMS